MTIRKVTHHFNKNYFELESWKKSLLVCGLDEVGRGCLAGPVVTAATILKPYKKNPLLKDSKLLTPKERLKAYRWLVKNSIFSIAIVNHRHIDKHNIYQATLKAMKRCVAQLLSTHAINLSYILVDAMPLHIDTSLTSAETLYFIKGEKKSSSIAAASIIAKVTRDKLMEQIGTLFPSYCFKQHKGYATQKHYRALRDHGLSIIHRESFTRIKTVCEENLSCFENTKTTITTLTK